MATGRASVSNAHPEPPPVTLGVVTRTVAQIEYFTGCKPKHSGEKDVRLCLDTWEGGVEVTL